MSDVMEDLAEFKHLAREADEEKRKVQLDELRVALREEAEEVKRLTALQTELNIELDKLGDDINTLIESIRKKWQPFITGADKSSLNLGHDLFLEATPVTNIKVEDEDASVEWFRANGFEPVMKWKMHDQTCKKIAREQLLDGRTIPGLAYSTFTKIKVK